MNNVLRAVDRLSGSLGVLAAWIVLPLIIATVYEVASRYLFNAPTIWAYEVGYMATGANFLLGAAFALREGAHIRIDVLYSRFSARRRALVDVLGYLLLFLPVALWLSYRLGTYALEAYHSGEGSGESAWNPVIWPFRAIFFIGFAVLSLQAIVEFIRALKVLTGRSDQGEVSRHG
ncbi:MAG: C4-dicarboxylate ABC transporter substrate-binding protein [Proteobacteria bacterium]|nr:MAG: C4-dicarboxylate ABC transporter substrate-binding protein [Pseudomonadota bacterium]